MSIRQSITSSYISFFETDRDQNPEVYRMAYDGSQQTNLSRQPTANDVLDLVPGSSDAGYQLYLPLLLQSEM